MDDVEFALTMFQVIAEVVHRAHDGEFASFYFMIEFLHRGGDLVIDVEFDARPIAAPFGNLDRIQFAFDRAASGMHDENQERRVQGALYPMRVSTADKAANAGIG